MPRKAIFCSQMFFDSSFSLFSKLITVESIFTLFSLFSSCFVYVIDEELKEALRKPAEGKQTPTHCCSVECEEGDEVAINTCIDVYRGSWWFYFHIDL